MTGKTPGKHGIFDFIKINWNDLSNQLVTTKDIKSMLTYEILTKRNLRSIIVNLPISFPPRDINGIILYDAFSPKKFAAPEVAKEYLANYRVFPDLKKQGMEYICDTFDRERKKFETVDKLLQNESWDFFFVNFHCGDNLLHLHMNDLLKNNKIGMRVKELFVEYDVYINKILKKTGNNTICILMSDHGFKQFKNVFYLNSWLYNKGYMTLSTEKQDKFKNLQELRNLDIGRTQSRGIKRVYFYATKITPTIAKKFLSKMSFKNFASIKNKLSVDYKNSKAFMPTTASYSIYINKRLKMDNLEKERLIKELVVHLKDIKDPNTGNNVFEKVFAKDELYSGSMKFEGSDILFISEKYFISDSVPSDLKLFDNYKIGFHDLNGIFLAYGPGINKGTEIKNAKIYDIAPTILHIFGLPIPKDMDGNVLNEIFEYNHELSKREPLYVDPRYYEHNEKERIEEKIKQLKINKKYKKVVKNAI
jgi:predicted AlkP superfamily phosphohydrolase/phosphomutase